MTCSERDALKAKIFAAVEGKNVKFMAAVLEIAAERDKLVGINARLLSALELYVALDNDRRTGCVLWDEDWAACYQPATAAIAEAREKDGVPR